ncbi:SLAC1 family transporter [Streptococcus dentasini]
MKQSLPLALTGLLLGMTALVNLIGKFVSQPIAQMLLILTVILWLILTGYLISHQEDCRKQLADLLPASTFPTYFMAMMLSPLVLPLPKLALTLIWTAGLIGHLSFLLLFTKLALTKPSWKTLYPGWFVIYVGPAAASISARVIDQTNIGWAIFYLTSLAYVILMLLLLYRLVKWPLLPAQIPNAAIMAAPSSLLLLALLQLSPSYSGIMVSWFLILSQGFYWGTVIFLAKQIKTWFVPTFSAFTFPSVSTATALVLSLMRLKLNDGWLLRLSQFEILLATVVVAYVAIGYLIYFNSKKAS